jgi:hypothetical protein
MGLNGKTRIILITHGMNMQRIQKDKKLVFNFGADCNHLPWTSDLTMASTLNLQIALAF